MGSFYWVNMYVNLYEYIEKEGKKFILENLKIDVIYKKNFKNMYWVIFVNEVMVCFWGLWFIMLCMVKDLWMFFELGCGLFRFCIVYMYVVLILR